MPIYEYKCKKGHKFEVRRGFTDDPVETCETCAAPVSRVFHPVAVHFKGKGFYSTDYGSKKRSRELKEAAEGSGKSKDGSSSGSDSSSSSGSDSGSKSGSDSGSKSDSKSGSESKAAASSSSSD
jgi:putative FmdB family regulatory protein